MKKEKSEGVKELVYKPIYLPVRFFKKEAYIHIDDYKEAINKRENAVNGLEIENKKQKEKISELEDVSKDYDLLSKDFITLGEENEKLKERIDVLYEFIERNDKLVDEVIDEEDLDKLNRYICIDDDLVDKALESED